jgi:hypothetical protein
MSASAIPAQTETERTSHALVFRIAFAAAGGLTLGEVLGWDFPFLPAMLAVQLLSGRGPISVKQGIGFVALIALAGAFSALITQLFVDSPLVLVLVISLLVFLEFLLIARGRAVAIANIFLITTAVVPLLAIESPELAYGFVYTLIAGSVLAVLLAFAAHAIFPSPAEIGQRAAPQPDHSTPVAAALANTAALMSLVIYFMLTVSPVSVVVVLTVIGILRQPAQLGGGTATGLILGNLVGGLGATAAYILVVLLPSPFFLFLVTLLGGLLFARRIEKGGDLAPIYTVGLMTFLLVLGLGLSPLPQDSSAIFIARVINVVVASIYAIATANLLRSAFRVTQQAS